MHPVRRPAMHSAKHVAMTSAARPVAAVVLTAEEQQLYHDAHARSKGLFQQYLGMGHASVNAHLLQIMALLQPMRRVCSGGVLKPKVRGYSGPQQQRGCQLPAGCRCLALAVVQDVHRHVHACCACTAA